MVSPNSTVQTRREHARWLNRLVDRALQGRGEHALVALLEGTVGEDTLALCNRISRRARLLVRHDPSQAPTIIALRDLRVLEVFAHHAPKSWFSAWCDGSSIADAGGARAGIGVVLMDPQHRIVSKFGESRGTLSALAAELAALEAAVGAAVAHGAECLRVHTDCSALIHLWQRQRNDDRLAGLRQALGSSRRLRLVLIPRRFNQLANQLARRAARGTSTRP